MLEGGDKTYLREHFLHVTFKPCSDCIGERGSNHFTKQCRTISVKGHVFKRLATDKALVASLGVFRFERTHNFTEGFRGHFPNVIIFQMVPDVFNELIQISVALFEVFEDSRKVVFPEEVICDVYNVRTHFYLLSETYHSQN